MKVTMNIIQRNMEIYSQEPKRIEKLILMDTNPKAELDEVKLKREPQIKEVNAEIIRLVFLEGSFWLGTRDGVHQLTFDDSTRAC